MAGSSRHPVPAGPPARLAPPTLPQPGRLAPSAHLRYSLGGCRPSQTARQARPPPRGPRAPFLGGWPAPAAGRKRPAAPELAW